MDGANTSSVPHAVASFYDRVLLVRAKPYLVHTNFGQTRNIPTGESNTIKFRKYGALTTATTPLTEMVTPEGNTPAPTDITAVVLQYGDYMLYSDRITYESPDRVLAELYKLLAEQAGQTIDELTRDILVAGTNVIYAGSGNVATADVAAGDVLTTTMLDNAEATLLSADAMYLTEFVSPSTGFNTQSVDPSFVAIIHPMQKAKVKALTGFVPVKDYRANGNVFPSEIGAYGNIRFVMSTKAKVKTGEGTGGIAVYTMLIIAQNAYGISAIDGHAMESITTPLGSAGTGDPLRQRGSVAWKATHVTKILNQSWMIRLEHALS